MVRPCYLLLGVGCFFLSDGGGLVTQDFKSDLHTLATMRKGRGTDLDAVDRRGAKLLEKYPDPKDQGQIYYTLADVHAQSEMAHPERVADYAHKALEYPQEPGQRERLYVYWGDALQLANPKEAFPDRRRSAVQPYLEGLKALLEYHLPDKPPEVPAVNSFEADPPNGPVYEALKRQHDQEWAAHNEAVFQREMIKHRDVLIGQIAGLYGRKPYAKDEVERLAHETLDNSALVDKLLAAVDVKMEADAARTPPSPVPIPSSPPKPTWGEARWLWTLASFVVLIAVCAACWFFELRKRRHGVGK
jgi:hypothetical protein